MIKNNNVRMALHSLGAAKWRSFLTTLGIIIGVASVVTIVSLGEGVKHQLQTQVKHTGTDLVTVRSGHIASRDSSGKITKVNILNLFAGANLNDTDYQTIKKTSGLKLAAPFAVVPGIPKTDTVEDADTSIVATNEHGAEALNQDVQYGGFFSDHDNDAAVAVIGPQVALDLFKEAVPVGKSFKLRGEEITVRGIFKHFEASPLTPGVDYNDAIFIPYGFAKRLGGGNPLQPYQVLARPAKGVSVASAAGNITTSLKNSHGGQTDFTVLKADDSIEVAGNLLTVLTSVVSAIAAISLVVGGIGIMNIMLVAVSERTYEIGIRKSIGATNRQILNQFMTEAIVLSAMGGIFGVLASLLINYLLRIFTSLQPVITLPVMGAAVLVALVVGIFFGITPALKAARKDPIQALRRV